VQGDAGHPDYRKVDLKIIVGKKWRAQEDERHKKPILKSNDRSL
jgi:hypothetical protein